MTAPETSLGERFALPPEVEDERMRSLHQLHVIDSPPEERFARITRMARAVFGVPMAAVSLVDRERQWFKQCDGLELGKDIPRGETVCQATIARSYEHPDDPALILEDAAAHPDFSALPAIGGDGGVRFYAGYPLYGPRGHPVGTFCIYDTEPRSLSATQLEAFREMAAWAQRELEQSDELDRAAEIQRHLLPLPLGDLPGYTVCAMCIPAFAVGGDFYDHYLVEGGIVVSVADVMGKGLGAAILTASVRSALRGASRAVELMGEHDVAFTVNSVAAQLADDFARTETFVTLFHARLDTETGDLGYVDAGHGLAVIVGSDGSARRLLGEGLPLGVLPADSWTAGHAMLGPGDMMVVVSDGSLDLLGREGDERAAVQFIVDHPSPAQMCSAVTALTDDKPPLDDVTVVAIQRDAL